MKIPLSTLFVLSSSLFLTSCAHTPAQDGEMSPSPTSSETDILVPTDSPSPTVVELSEEEQAKAVVESFVSLFFTPELPAATWYTRIHPYLTPLARQTLRAFDHSTLPNNPRIVEIQTNAESDFLEFASFTLRLEDDTAWRITLARADVETQWQVLQIHSE